MEYNTIIEILEKNGYKPYLTKAFVLVNLGIKHKDIIFEFTYKESDRVLFKIMFARDLFKPIFKGFVSSKEELENIILSNIKQITN